MDSALDLQRALAALGLGVCGALLLAWALRLAGGGPPAPGPPRVWLADRDAGRVWALDDDGFVAQERRLAFPLALAATTGGELVVLQATGPGPSAPRRLLRLGPDGARIAELRRPAGARPETAGASALAALEVDAAGTVFTLTGPPSSSRLVAWGRSGERRELDGVPGARDLRRGPERLWLLGEEGSTGLRLADLRPGPDGPAGIDPDAAALRLGWPGEAPLDAVFDAGGSWWLTATGRGRRLRRLDPAGALQQRIEGPPRAVLLVADGQGGAWCVGEDGGWRRLTAGGGLGRGGEGLLRPVRSACPDGSGGFWAISPGAAQRVGRSGRLRFAQGGFDVLVDVAAAPAPR